MKTILSMGLFAVVFAVASVSFAAAGGGQVKRLLIDEDGNIRGTVDTGITCQEFQASDHSGILLACKPVDVDEDEEDEGQE